MKGENRLARAKFNTNSPNADKLAPLLMRLQQLSHSLAWLRRVDPDAAHVTAAMPAVQRAGDVTLTRFRALGGTIEETSDP